MPAVSSASASSRRFSSALRRTRSGASSMMRSTLGFFVPPTFSTAETRSAGWMQNFVRPTSESPSPRSNTSSVSDGQSEMMRMVRNLRGPATAFREPVPFVMRIITREELKAKIDRGDHFALFEVLPLMYFRKHHLPTAKNLPPTAVATVVPELVPDRSSEIILYCWDHDCPTSGWA